MGATPGKCRTGDKKTRQMCSQAHLFPPALGISQGGVSHGPRRPLPPAWHCASRLLVRTLRFSHSGTASTIAGGPAVNVSERPIRRRFRGSLPPRTQAHFVFVRSVELNEQTTRPSRTVWCSGASPAFGVPQSPLRAGLLVHTSFSAHFQDCQALQALASSCSSPCPHGQLHAFALG